MNLQKVKLIKGAFLEVAYLDGSAVVSKSYPNTEAPPKLVKAFAALNPHLCKLTCQYDKEGNLDNASVVCRGYYFKGEGEKEALILTGLRQLPNGRVLIIPASPMINLEADSGYSDMTDLIKKLEECRKVVLTFMENNKGEDEIQGKLDLNPNKDQGTKTHILKANKGKKDEEADEDLETLTEQEKMDREIPLTQEMLQAANAEKNRRAKKK